MIVPLIAAPRHALRPPRGRPRWLSLFALRQEPHEARRAPGDALPAMPAMPSIPGATHPASRAGASGGDAFERFFAAHEAMITGYLYRMTGDAQSAADLSQETFLRAWQRFDRIQTYERPGAWLVRVATNLALQHRRRRQAPVGAAMPLDDAISPGASDPGARFAERDHVRAALLELPAKPRAMLVLREVYGLTGEEVAEALGMSREAVKVALWRARAQFRSAYLRREERP